MRDRLLEPSLLSHAAAQLALEFADLRAGQVKGSARSAGNELALPLVPPRNDSAGNSTPRGAAKVRVWPPRRTLNAMEVALTFSSRSLSAPAEGSTGLPLAAASDSASPAHNSRCIAMRRAERGARLGDDPPPPERPLQRRFW